MSENKNWESGIMNHESGIMNKFSFILPLALVIGVGVFLFVSINRDNDSKDGQEPARVCLRNVCYEVEIAQTPDERARGLMFRDSLDESKGMLFVFDKEAKHSFWMKNTIIALDIIWIDEGGKIVYISQNTPPCERDFCPSYAPDAPAKYVLEVAAGQTQKIGAAVGDGVALINY